MSGHGAADIILTSARNAGLTHFGFCRFEDVPKIACAASKRLPERAQSVIVFLLPYDVGEYPGRNVARYAMLRDYHAAGGAMLEKIADGLRRAFPLHSFVPFIDNSPLAEVRAAHLAGLGVIGRHGLLISRDFGSHVFIGEIVTTLGLPPDAPVPGGCADCGLCEKRCPTGALGARGFNKALCRSHITQKKGALTDFELEQVRQGGMVWGCDVCADACPMNRQKKKSDIAAFYDGVLPQIDAKTATLSDRAWAYKGKDILLRNLKLIEGQSETKGCVDDRNTDARPL